MKPTDAMASLNDAQREAVLHQEGPLLVLAGPGSGKTRVVTLRLARLLEQGVPPRQLLALTFTNKAADEMRSRLQRLAPEADLWLGTFHRLGARLLRRYARLVGLEPNFTICDAEDSLNVLKQALRDSDLDLTHCTPGQLAQNISWAKSRMIGPDQYEPGCHALTGLLTAQAYPLYQRQLQQANAVDFDDLLYYVARLLRENPELRASLDAEYRYVMVDEYQDTNHAQYAIARALSIDYPNLAVTGDPDQSIYAWRGANIDNILEFERDFPDAHVVRLETNYRSSPEILQLADALIAHNLSRKPKRLLTSLPSGPPVRLHAYPSDRDEARHIAQQIAEHLTQGARTPGDFAIFYRTNAQSRLLEQALREAGAPYQIVHGVEFYQRREIRDTLAYLQLVNNPRNHVALRRVINMPPRRVGQKSLQRLERYAQEQRLSLLDACRSARAVPSLPRPAAAACSVFSQLIDDLSIQAHQSVEALIEHLLQRTQLREYFLANDEQGEDRAANINELLLDARDFDATHPQEGSLELFLEQRSLVNDTDDWDDSGGRVSLMTLHAAKGLEFRVVFLVGVEEGLLPHKNARESEAAREEERRLLFVGITRAKEELQLSFAHQRGIQGRLQLAVPSSFLLELPRAEMQIAGALPRSWRREQPDQGLDRSAGLWPEDEAFAQPEPEESGYDQRHVDDLEQAPAAGWSEAPASDSDAPVSARAGDDAASAPPPTPHDRDAAPRSRAPLLTAAEMLRGSTTPVPSQRLAPEAFREGMLVRHPEYGEGRVLGLSGAHKRLVATVQFFALDRPTKISLFHSSLAPAAGPSDA